MNNNHFTLEEMESIAWHMFRCGEYTASQYENFCLSNNCLPSDIELQKRFLNEVGEESSEYFELCDMFAINAF